MAKNNQNKQAREKHRFWQAHINAWEKSGLLQVEYCRQHDLSESSFIYWKKKFVEDSTAPARKRNTFVAVPVVTSNAVRRVDEDQSDSGVKIQLGNLTITLTDKFNPDVLARAIYTLGGKP